MKRNEWATASWSAASINDLARSIQVYLDEVSKWATVLQVQPAYTVVNLGTCDENGPRLRHCVLLTYQFHRF